MIATALENTTLQTPLPNPSLQVTADHQIKQVDTPVYAPKAGEVLVHIKATGVCGSDIHFWKTGRIGSLVFEGDCTIGHEAAGVVLKCGEGVTEFKPGDRVALEPGVPCGTCFLCLEGRYNLCPTVAFAGVYPYDGTLQRYKIHPAKWLHKLPDALSFAEGALLEPLSVVLHGIRTAGGGPGGSGGAVTGGLALGCPVLICGAGPIGLIALAAARASGAYPIVITDVDAGRLQFSQRFVQGCRAYKVDTTKSVEENARGVRSLFGATSEAPIGYANDEYLAPRTVLECTGVESSICTAAFSCRRGGAVIVIGVGKPVMNGLPFMHMSLAEIDLKFINRYRDTWAAGIACLEGGILDLKPLVTHTFPLEEAKRALEFSSDYSNGCIKVQIVDEVEGPLL